MALAHQPLHPSGRGQRSRTDAVRPRGLGCLAEVIPIRPLPDPRSPGDRLRSLFTLARDFASPRAQAASVGSPPRPPSSPAPRTDPRPPAAPHDAA